MQSVVERRNTIPILSNVLLTASPGQLALSTTDLDMEIADSSPARVEATGAVTAPAHTLYEIVRELPEGADVTLSYTGADPRLEVQAGRSCFNLPVLPAGDFPVMSRDGVSEPIAIDTRELIRLIDKTRAAICTEETRYYLNGLYLHGVVEDGVPKLRTVATDGKRLALAEAPAPPGFAGLPGVIIPRKTIHEARRLLDGAGESVTLGVSAQKVRFGFGAGSGGATMTSKVIDGAFPAYDRLVPRDNSRILTLDATLFAAAVRRVATISSEQLRPVALSVETGRVTLTVRNLDAGQAVEALEGGYEGEPFQIGFNARYLLDVLAQIEGETVQFRFSDRAGVALDAALVLDPADAGAQYVLMPMRV